MRSDHLQLQWQKQAVSPALQPLNLRSNWSTHIQKQALKIQWVSKNGNNLDSCNLREKSLRFDHERVPYFACGFQSHIPGDKDFPAQNSQISEITLLPGTGMDGRSLPWMKTTLEGPGLGSKKHF